MSRPPQKWKTLLTGSLKIAFAAGIIYWLVANDKLNFSELKLLLSPLPFLICTLIVGANIWIASERWRGLLKSQDLGISSFEALKLTLIGVFFNFAVPGGVGGDVVKAYYVARENPQNKLKTVLTILMDRLLGLFSMLILAILSALIYWERVSSHPQLKLLFWFLVTCFLGFMLFWCFIFSNRLFQSGFIQKLISKIPSKERLLSLYTALGEYRTKKEFFYKSILISILTHTIAITFFIYVGELLMDGGIPLSLFFFVVPIGFMATALPIAPAGVGVGQAAFYFLFNIAQGFESNLGSNSVTAFQMFTLLWGLLGAFFYLTRAKSVPQMAGAEA